MTIKTPHNPETITEEDIASTIAELEKIKDQKLRLIGWDEIKTVADMISHIKRETTQGMRAVKLWKKAKKMQKEQQMLKPEEQSPVITKVIEELQGTVSSIIEQIRRWLSTQK